MAKVLEMIKISEHLSLSSDVNVPLNGIQQDNGLILQTHLLICQPPLASQDFNKNITDPYSTMAHTDVGKNMT